MYDEQNVYICNVIKEKIQFLYNYTAENYIHY